MTEPRTSRITDTAARANTRPTTPSSPPTTFTGEPPRHPGGRLLHSELGPEGHRLLQAHRTQHDTALGQLAELTWQCALEADRLHRQLRRYATNARDRYIDAVRDDERYPGIDIESEITAIQQHPGHAATLYAARLTQQLGQLTQTVKAYRYVADLTTTSP
ncbi:hypothetical protein AB0J38_11665 [Streptomyces sp. NPDC050095]|uniref:hypothetical protein n=1 Tax=unclassified Streptomyces TaxID=2593676 RepID=UPI0034378FD0